MGLDKFMGTKKTSVSIKKSKKKENKPSRAQLEVKDHLDREIESDDVKETSDTKYNLITLNLYCSTKCGYKKTLKRSKSFKSSDADLNCPKCGKTMKIRK